MPVASHLLTKRSIPFTESWIRLHHELSRCFNSTRATRRRPHHQLVSRFIPRWCSHMAAPFRRIALGTAAIGRRVSGRPPKATTMTSKSATPPLRPNAVEPTECCLRLKKTRQSFFTFAGQAKTSSPLKIFKITDSLTASPPGEAGGCNKGARFRECDVFCTSHISLAPEAASAAIMPVRTME